MKKAISNRLTRGQLAELRSLAALPDSTIDRLDAPELLDWSGAKRSGLFYRPVKQQLTLRVDADVVAWFKNTHRPPMRAIRHVSIEHCASTCRDRRHGAADRGFEIAALIVDAAPIGCLPRRPGPLPTPWSVRAPPLRSGPTGCRRWRGSSALPPIAAAIESAIAKRLTLVLFKDA